MFKPFWFPFLVCQDLEWGSRAYLGAAFILSSLVAQYSSRIGRKPFLLAILFGQVTKISCFLLALLLHSRVPAALLFLGYLLFELIFGANGVILLGNMMVTDVTVPETRCGLLLLLFSLTRLPLGRLHSLW